jgi:hypothetical protein
MVPWPTSSAQTPAIGRGLLMTPTAARAGSAKTMTVKDDRPRARVATRIARSSSTTFKEEGASARRWTPAETRSRVEAGPKFRFDPPSIVLLSQLVNQYRDITGDLIRTPRKRNLLAGCYRVHGADVIPFIRDEFAIRGTAQNLLGVIRCAPPRGEHDRLPLPDQLRNPLLGERRSGIDDAATRAPADHDGPPCPVERCLRDLIYCAGHQPPFDPASRARYDRRPSNPDADSYFSTQSSNTGVLTIAHGTQNR